MKQLLFQIFIALHSTYNTNEAKMIFNELLELL